MFIALAWFEVFRKNSDSKQMGILNQKMKCHDVLYRMSTSGSNQIPFFNNDGMKETET